MKIDFSKIPKKYENFYSTWRTLSWCRERDVSVYGEMEEPEYRLTMRKIFRQYQLSEFDFLVKYYWLAHKFCYKGKVRTRFNRNGILLDRAYGTYLKCHVGYNNVFIQNPAANKKLFSYMDDFFPDLLAQNPFKTKMKYPYKYMNFECLYLVSEMPERLELLSYGEKKKMIYRRFVDYVINYAMVINEWTGDNVFGLYNHSHESEALYVRFNYKHKIKASDFRQRVSQLSSARPVPAKLPA